MAHIIETAGTYDSHDVYYRFTCEHCGHTSEWYKIHFSREADARVNPYKPLNEFEELALSAKLKFQAESYVRQDIEYLRSEVAKGNYPDEFALTPVDNNNYSKVTFAFKEHKCPKCGKTQSWAYLSGLKLRFGAIAAGIGFLVFALILGLTANLSIAIISNVTVRLIVMFFLLGGGTFGSFMLGQYLFDKKIAEMRKKSENSKNLPEINWNGR